jgi:hypothetical protein
MGDARLTNLYNMGRRVDLQIATEHPTQRVGICSERII